MFWVLLTAIVLLVLLIGLKILEVRTDRKTWLSQFFLNQDPKIEKFVGFLSARTSSIKKRIKFLIYVRLPFVAGFVLRKSIVKIIDRSQEVKDSVRGKIKIKSERINASPFLKEIAKIKSRKHKKPTFFD